MEIKIAFIVVFFLEMLISAIFFSNISDRKLSVSKTLFIGTILFEFGAVINIFLISNAWLNALYSITANFLFASFCYNIKKLRGLFYSLLLIAISTFLEIIFVFIFSTITSLHIYNYRSNILQYVMEVVLSKVIYFFLIMLIIRFIKEGNQKIKIPINFYVYPAIAMISVIFFWYISSTEQIEYTNQIILSIISFLLFMSTILMFFSYQTHAQKEAQLLLLQQEQDKIKTDISYYEVLERQNTDLRIYAHDAQNHISAIKDLNTDPEIDSYVSEMLESLEKHINVSHSGNRILDVIINKYVTECNIHNIKFTFDVKNNNLAGLEYHDTVTILSNLLDNAIDAALLSKKRSITFETDYRNNYSIIIISNSSDNQPLFDDNKTPITTKPNKALHGFGLRSVKKVIKKYSGDFALEYDENKKTFIVTAMLNLNK